MFETGIRQLRMALGMISGRRLDTRNISRLVDDAPGRVPSLSNRLEPAPTRPDSGDHEGGRDQGQADVERF